jgi:hypothetical protein
MHASAGVAPPEARHSSYSSLNTKDNPPCNTLFIGNLGDTVDEPELQTFFSVHPVRPPPATATHHAQARMPSSPLPSLPSIVAPTGCS